MADTTSTETPSAPARRPRRKPAQRKGGAGSRKASVRQPDPQSSVARARAAMGKAGAASRKTIERLLKQWRRMDSSRRLQLAAALLGALAAASAPIVRSRLKKK